MKIDNKEDFIKYKMDYLSGLLAQNRCPLVGDDRKEVSLVMEKIVDAGNSYILNNYYLHYFVYEAISAPLGKRGTSSLLILLKGFETKNEDELYDNITIMYNSIYSCCKWWRKYDVKDDLRIVFANGTFPLINDIDAACYNILYSGYRDYTIFHSIINCIKAYCVIHEKTDSFMNYFNLLLYDKVSLLDDLLFHDIISEDIVTDPYKFNRLELRKYVINRLDNCDIERKELK